MNKKLAVLAMVALLVPVLLALFPIRHPGKVDLGNPMFEAATFAICMLLWVTARAGRWGGDAYFAFRSNIWDVDLRMFRRNIVAGVVEFLLLAGALQVLEIFIPYRKPSLEKISLDSASIISLGVILFLGFLIIVKLIPAHRSMDKNKTG